MAVPIRTCVGCRVRRPNVQLVRYVAVDGELAADRHGAGRGAWICAASHLACFDKAVTKGTFPRALRKGISTAALNDLRERLSAVGSPQI